MRKLETNLALLKQDLKSESEKIKHKKRLSERKRINNQFFKNLKQVYRSMKGNNIIVEKLSEKDLKMFGKTKQVLMTRQNGYNNLKKIIVGM